MARRARERLLESARDLFAADGIRAVSVEQLLERSGVGRASFYRHFATKDELVVAVLSRYNERWHAMLRRALCEGAGVLTVFDVLAARLSEPDYRGCLALTALMEFRERGHPVHRAAMRHQKATAAGLAELLDPGLSDEERSRIGRQLLQLVDAAMIAALDDRSGRPVAEARATAAALLDSTRAAPTEDSPRDRPAQEGVSGHDDSQTARHPLHQ